MSWIDDFVEGPVVDGINKIGKVVDGNKEAIAGASSTLVSITLERDELIEIAKDVGKKSTIGAGFDGLFGLYKAAIFYKKGLIGKKEFAHHLLSEIGCGFISSVMGNAASVTVKLVFAPHRSVSFLVGIGVSAGTRWIYRNYVPDGLPDVDEKEDGNEDMEEKVREVLDTVFK